MVKTVRLHDGGTDLISGQETDPACHGQKKKKKTEIEFTVINH